jgi:hypothetical protein
MNTVDHHNAGTTHNAVPPAPRSWPIRAIVLLLLVQALGLASIVVLTGTRLDWLILVSGWTDPDRETAPLLIGGLFLPLAALALSGALGVWIGRRTGWIMAMLAQVGLLLGCLTLYFDERPGFVYPLMLSCIALVLYLNSSDVRLAFQLATSPAALEDEDAA